MIRAELTKAMVEKAQPGPKRYFIWDTKVPGFCVRIGREGKAYMVKYRTRDGTQRWPKIADVAELKGGVQAAREIARDWLEEVRKGGDPSRERKEARRAETVNDLAKRFFDEHVEPYLKPRTAGLYSDLLRLHILPAIGTSKVATVDRRTVEKLHQKVGKAHPVTANRCLQVLSSMFGKAEDWKLRPTGSNPAMGVRRFREKAKERFLDGAERAALIAAIDEAAKKTRGEPKYISPGALACLRLLALTGCRLSEITGLTWAAVDIPRSSLRLEDSKTGAKVVPLSPHAIEVLEALKDNGSELVCPSEEGTRLGNMQRVWSVIRKRAGLDDVRLHDLRHSAASDALADGLPIELVGALLGHRSASTTRRYAHLHDDVLRQAAKRMGDAIDRRSKEGAKK